MTSRVKLRSAVTLMPQKINHALRSAERLAVTDILSNGRMEFYGGRANTTIAMRAFNVDPNETLAQMEEGLALLKKSMREDIFTFEEQVLPDSATPACAETASEAASDHRHRRDKRTQPRLGRLRRPRCDE